DMKAEIVTAASAGTTILSARLECGLVRRWPQRASAQSKRCLIGSSISVKLDFSSLHQSTHYFARMRFVLRTPVDTDCAHKPGRLPCGNARACNARGAPRVRDAMQKYRSAPPQFVRRGRATLQPISVRHNRPPGCRPATNTADNVSSMRPDSPR